MAGVHLLKHMKGLSDEETCAAWLENPYFQAFCGETHFQHALPFDRSSMTRWRSRIGPGDLEALLAETITVAVKTKAVSHRQLERAEKILGQQASDKNKLYALHAPEVECIGKGKARTKYEFGVKTSIATTNERYKGGQFVLGAMALPGAPMTAIHWRTRLIRSQSLPERL
jgi:IS5 family transposase